MCKMFRIRADPDPGGSGFRQICEGVLCLLEKLFSFKINLGLAATRNIWKESPSLKSNLL